MKSLPAQVSAAMAIGKRDLLLFVSYRAAVVTTFFTTLVSLTLFHFISRLIHSSQIGSPDEYYAFVVVGIVILAVLTSTLSVPVITLRQELVAGTFERMVLSPVGPIRCILSLLIFPLVLSVATSIVTIAFATIVFGLKLRWATVPLAIPVGLLGAIAFAPFGLLMAAAVVRFKQTNAGATLVITAVTLLAGVYFPVSLLPHWIRWASDVQPFTPAVDILRKLLVNTPLQESLAFSLGKLLAFPAVMLPLALWVLGRAIRESQRRGTIIEY